MNILFIEFIAEKKNQNKMLEILKYIKENQPLPETPPPPK